MGIRLLILGMVLVLWGCERSPTITIPPTTEAIQSLVLIMDLEAGASIAQVLETLDQSIVGFGSLTGVYAKADR
ncbi:MAG: hypothetical protein F6K30_12955 [Cyanothece sp. SIO2G6]|nr:hypothetical protein [Cyanothece sp. SIO2G6]